MFTGIIEAVGTINQIKKQAKGAAVRINVGQLDMSDVHLGDSIATNGICLTVVDYSSTHFVADVSSETLSRTQLGSYKAGTLVNLEKAMLPTTRFGGHIVSGHVDAVAEICGIEPQGNSTDYYVSLMDDFAPYVVEKGSVTIDGVSLTVNSVLKDKFRLTIVPHTQQETIISSYKLGTKVNIEIDVIARYVERLMQFQRIDAPKGTVSMSLLAKSGFIK